MNLSVLIACEFSGRIRSAFRALGYEAWSCDIEPAEDGSEFHLLMDAKIAIKIAKWDLMIAHPPCRFLALAGNRWINQRGRKTKRKEALQFFRMLWEANIPRICLENPMSIATRIAPKSQTIHPWQFGHKENKTTWLWFKNLPPLKPTKIIPARVRAKIPVAELNRVHHEPPGPEREKNRSRTFQGIAKAMAAQWGPLLERRSV